jgi:hypothetical protein
VRARYLLPELADVPAAHRHDPPGSHEAAHAITTSGHRQRQLDRVYSLVLEFPGRTAGELAAESAVQALRAERDSYDAYQVRRRLYDLKELGLALRGATRRCEAVGTTQSTWWPSNRQLGMFG